MTENKDINYKAMISRVGRSNKSSAKIIVKELIRIINPKTVLDVGCGIGVWLEEFDKYNTVEKVQGIDGEWILENSLLIDKENIEIYDFEDTSKEPRCIRAFRYDLAICLEMAEHVSKKRADYLIDNLVNASDVIYFSAATPKSGGYHHVNERWQSYWINKFKDRGYVVIDCIRPLIWNNKNVCYYYAEESFIFIKEDRIKDYPLLNHFKNKCIYNIIHPIHFEEQIVKSSHEWSYLLDIQKKLFRAYKGKILFNYNKFMQKVKLNEKNKICRCRK